MSTIVTRAGKGAPLTNTEMDSNLTNLNNDKYQSGDSPTFTLVNGITVGKGAGAVSTNTAVGASALATNSTGSGVTAVGESALKVSTGNNNTAVGKSGLTANTSGTENTTIGKDSLGSNTTGSNNTAVGSNALVNNTTASNNTAVGYQAGYANTTGTELVALGYLAARSVTTGNSNTIAGVAAGYTLSTGSNNTIFGNAAGYYSTGSDNTFIGASAGGSMTSGAKNTIVGKFTGAQNGYDIRASNSKVVISDGDGYIRYYHDGAGTGNLVPNVSASSNTYGFDTQQFYPYPDNALKLGNASFRWSTVYATTGTINTSDANTKQDIAALDDAEKRVAVTIKSLIKKYRFKDAVAEKGDAARIHIGAIAQEVQAAFVAEGLDPARYALFCSDTWYEVDGKAGKPAEPYTAETPNAVEVTRLGLRYEELLAFVIAAL